LKPGEVKDRAAGVLCLPENVTNKRKWLEDSLSFEPPVKVNLKAHLFTDFSILQPNKNPFRNNIN
jgi:hypothetical protein